MTTGQGKSELSRDALNALIENVEPDVFSHSYIYWRPFNVNRVSDHPELKNCLTDLVQELDMTLGRKRKRDRQSADRFRAAVRAICLDLYVSWKDDPKTQIAISRGKPAFQGQSRYRSLFFTYDTFIDAFNSLRAAKYFVVDKSGYYNARNKKGMLTRIRATQKLLDKIRFKTPLSLAWIGDNQADEAKEVIILRRPGKKKEKIEYDDTPETRRMRANLKMINGLLNRSWIDLRITDHQMEVLNARMKADYKIGARLAPAVDFTARTLHRVFNNAKWEDGGRFYGGWWQIVPKEYREYITINDKPTVEVDFSGMHLIMMYALVGEQFSGEPYDIGMPFVPRAAIKDAFLKMINADVKKRIVRPEELKGPNQKQLWKEVQRKIWERHKPIEKYMRSGFGVSLQRMDADIAELVMLHFLPSGYICLPIHDSFIVHHALADELREVMLKAFKEKVGKEVDTKQKAIHLDAGITRIGPRYGFSIEPMTNELSFGDDKSEYAGHENRTYDWRAMQATNK